MIRSLIGRLGLWYNALPGIRQRYYLLIGCAGFLVLLWLSLYFIRFDGRMLENSPPVNIGQPSGLLPKIINP